MKFKTRSANQSPVLSRSAQQSPKLSQKPNGHSTPINQSFNSSTHVSYGVSPASHSFNSDGVSLGVAQNNVQPEPAEIEDGPTFKEALRAFKNTSISSNTSSNISNNSFQSPNRYESAHQIISSSSKQIQHSTSDHAANV